MIYKTACEAKQALLASGKADSLSEDEINCLAAFAALHGKDLDIMLSNIEKKKD
jgi:hypothetical protein